MLKRVLLMLMFAVFLSADGMNFDFADARKKGYSDKEILDYVSKNFTSYDINNVRAAGLSDMEIVDFFIQRDQVNSQLRELARGTFGKMQASKVKVFPEEVSSRLAMGCLIYTGKMRQSDGWSYVAKLTDFASATYTTAYLSEANYFDIDKAEGVSLKSICATWLDRLVTTEEINKLYALSLVNEITKLVKSKKSLILD